LLAPGIAGYRLKEALILFQVPEWSVLLFL
jgi:hypothetical protein